MNSTPSSSLQNTGAGIGTLGILKQPVQIGVIDERLQMILQDKTHADKVVRNEYYG